MIDARAGSPQIWVDPEFLPGSRFLARVALPCPSRSAHDSLWGRHAEVGELALQIVVRLQPGGWNQAVGQPGKTHAVDVVGQDSAIGIAGGPGAVEPEDVGSTCIAAALASSGE